MLSLSTPKCRFVHERPDPSFAPSLASQAMAKASTGILLRVQLKGKSSAARQRESGLAERKLAAQTPARLLQRLWRGSLASLRERRPVSPAGQDLQPDRRERQR